MKEKASHIRRTFSKGVIINFRNRSIGIFEIVEPLLEGDEVFDSSMLRQNVESMIASGKRNVCVDLSQLDYLYSDTINALIVINRRMLDVMGRLSLLAPQPSVLEILKKSGVQNILKIFLNDGELLRTSEELMNMGQMAGLARAPAPRPQSEFDDLRNEIGSALETPSSAAPGSQMQGPMRPQAPAQAPGPFAEPAFQQPQGAMGMQQPRQAYVPPAPPQFAPPPPPGPAPRYAPPPLRPFEPGVPKPAARSYTPAPPAKPAPLSTGAETRRMQQVPEMAAASRQQPSIGTEEDLERFEATLEKKAPTFEKPKHDRFDDELEEVGKKKSFAPILIGLVILVVLAAGGYFGYMTFSHQKGTKTPVVTTPAVKEQPKETPVPQIPVDTTKIAEKPATPQTGVKEEPKKPEEPAKVEEPKKPPVQVAAKPRPAPRPTPRVEPRPEPRPEPRLEPRPEPRQASVTTPIERTPPSNIEVVEEEDFTETPPPRPAVTQPRVTTPPPPEEPIEPIAPPGGGEAATVFIASIPPVADIYMDGKLIGKTNISELKVTAGTHTLKFVKGDKEVTKQQTFTAGKNPSMMVRIQ